jgi:signal-transduction protein with cAMP-binding, CBS, and nucleotidyltransferase domain
VCFYGKMAHPAVMVLPKTKLREAANKMHKFGVSFLVVVKGRPAGIVTKRDLLEPLAQMEKPIRVQVQGYGLKRLEK